MRVFLSWSGERSHRVAQALKRNIARLSDEVDVWESDDLPPGSEWARSLMPNIERAELAVLCLTRRNLSAPWISFELGAFYRSEFERTAVPYLLDVEKDELEFPVGMFQAVNADRSGTKRLLWRIAEALGVDETAFEDQFATEIWPNLGEELDEIRRVDEEGRWMNIANAFFLGHDLRWTIATILERGLLPDVQHGLRQIVHHASELGLSGSDEFDILAARVTPVLELSEDEWSEETAADLGTDLAASLDQFRNVIVARQPGYTPYPEDNQDHWLRIKAERRA